MVTLDPRSFVLGFMAAYAFSIIVCAALLLLDAWQARKARDKELDWRIAGAAVASLNAPPDLRVMK